MTTDFIIDEYVSIRAGEPYRLLPFGVLVKNGKRRTVTPELAHKFKLPHFKPPIKLGSHREETPSGGSIMALEVRDDGLYAIPEYTDKGARSVDDGDYRYHSPEVIWDEDAGFEDPVTGELINGPLIVGDALLHTPHLGEQTAFYAAEVTQEGDQPMTEDKNTVEVPRSWFEAVVDWFKGQPIKAEPEPLDAAPGIDADEFAAVKAERDELAAKIEAQQAEAEHKARVDEFGAALKETKADPELAEVMAGLDATVAERIMQQFKALSAQVNEAALLDEKGTAGDGAAVDPMGALQARISEVIEERELNYAAAVKAVAAEHPELYEAAYKA